MHCVRVGEDGLWQLWEREADGPGGVAFSLDDLVGRLYDLRVHRLPVLVVARRADVSLKVAEADARHVYARPYGHWKCIMD